MIWALLFSLFFTNNEPVYIIPNLQKHVKKHVKNDNRKEQIITLRIANKKNRKKFNKKKEAFKKKYRKLSLNKETSYNEFSKAMEDFKKVRYQHQLEEIESISKIKGLITEVEWKLILKESEKGFEKEKRRVNKIKRKIRRNSQKAELLIRSEKLYNANETEIESGVKVIFERQMDYINLYLDLLERRSSVLHTYKAPQEEYEHLIHLFNKHFDSIMDSIANAHFVLVSNSTNRTWKRLLKKTKME